MDNTFHINRFGKLLAYDGRKYIRNFGLTFAILCGLNLVLWLLTLIFGFTMPTLPRWGIIYLAVLLAIIMVPAKAFGDINLPREGVRFAMLPVSNLEKYLSYALYCLLTPITVLLVSWGFDSLLTLLPFGGFDNYIQHFGMSGIMQDFITEIGATADVDIVSETNEDLQKFYSMFDTGFNYAVIISMVFNVGLFMFGNLLFKTHKTGKTLACMIGVSYVISLMMQIFFAAKGIFPWMESSSIGVSVDLDEISNLTNSMMSFSNIFRTLLTIGLYIGLFFKLKTQKY